MWKQFSGIDIKDSPVLDEYIIFGFPNNTDALQVLNNCTIYAEYYIQRLFENNLLDLYVCLMQLKLALEIEYNICKSRNKEKYILKYKFVYHNK